MYTVLFADDESSIREGLKYVIDWQELGFDIIGEAGNGIDTLKMILEEKPDLVLLDIRMPKMHGTEVIRAAREQGYTGKCIILSGYSDFQYAQTAIKCGVDFYLTKPIDDEELLTSVVSVKEALDEENSRDNFISSYRVRARNSILEELLTSDDASGVIVPEKELHELNLKSEVYQVVIYENFRKRISALSYDFAELMNITNNGNQTFEHLEIDDNDVILLKGNIAIKLFMDFLNHYETHPPQKDSPLDTLFLAYGSSVGSISEISRSYREALSLINRRFFCSQGQHTLGYSELPSLPEMTDSLNSELLSEYAQKITDYLQTYNRKKVAETLYGLEQCLYRISDTIPAIKLFLTDLYLQIKERISHLYGMMEIPFPTNSAIIEQIDNKFYLYEIIRFFSEQFEMIMNATGNSSRTSILDDVIYYIDHNYQNNIKLETIAPLFGYNSAYLGKIFNKAVNESFNSYVDHIRIEHSKELLKANKLKVYEISERIGYKNVDYFHKKFKKYVGMSPAEYRKEYLGDTETLSE